MAVLIGGESGAVLGTVMRHDLSRPSPREVAIGIPSDEMLCGLQQFAAVAERHCARAVVMAFVDDRPGLDAAAYDIADVFGGMLAEVGIDLIGAHAIRRIALGERWWSLLGDSRCGRLPNPESSSVTAAHVYEGRRIRGSRAELEQLLDRAPVVQRRRIAEFLDTEEAEPTGTAARRRLVEYVLLQIDRVASGVELDEPELARLGSVLRFGSVRDCLLALPLTDRRDAAEQLWTTLARVMPDPLRAQPAMLLGYAAYLHGDGPLAGIALAAALESDPGNKLAVLLDTSLQFGLPPDKVHDLADQGAVIARRLGIDLGPAGE